MNFYVVKIIQDSKDPPYTNIEFYNLTDEIAIWCKITFGNEHESGKWWWQSCPAGAHSNAYFYFRNYDDYVLCNLIWLNYNIV